MKTWLGRLIFVAIFFGFVLAALLLRNDNGYVLLQYGEWQVETSVVLLVAVIAAAVLLLWWLALFLSSLIHAPAKVREFAERRTQQRARRELIMGVIELGDGRWQRAEKRLLRHVGDSDTALVNYLFAARAAQLQGADDRRDRYLSLAQESIEGADSAVLLAQAELQLEQNQPGQALATLESLLEKHPQHTHGLQLLYRLHQQSDDWQNIQSVLPKLRAQKLISSEEADRIEIEAAQRELLAANPDGEQGDAALERLSKAWQQVPQNQRQAIPLVQLYAQELRRAGGNDSAGSLIEGTLRRNWDESLAGLYGLLETSDISRQLASAESWLKSHGDSAVLLLTLGRLSMRNKLWGKARSYLEASVSCGPRPDAYQELGLLLTSLGETEAATMAFRRGLAEGLNRDQSQLVSLAAPADDENATAALPSANS